MYLEQSSSKAGFFKSGMRKLLTGNANTSIRDKYGVTAAVESVESKVALPGALLGLGSNIGRLVPIGHYACKGYQKPSGSNSVALLRLKLDPQALAMSSVTVAEALQRLDQKIEQLLPRPVRFRKVWEQKRGKRELCVWRAVPPNADCVALGMVATNSAQEPNSDCIRCVPREWLVESAQGQKLLWADTSAAGGTAGSIWAVPVVNEAVQGAGLMVANSSHNAPDSKMFVFKSSKMRL